MLISVSFAKENAFSLVKSRFAIRQPDFFGVFACHPKDDLIHKNGRDHIHGRNPFPDQTRPSLYHIDTYVYANHMERGNNWSSHSFA